MFTQLVAAVTFAQRINVYRASREHVYAELDRPYLRCQPGPRSFARCGVA